MHAEVRVLLICGSADFLGRFVVFHPLLDGIIRLFGDPSRLRWRANNEYQQFGVHFTAA